MKKPTFYAYCWFVKPDEPIDFSTADAVIRLRDRTLDFDVLTARQMAALYEVGWRDDMDFESDDFDGELMDRMYVALEELGWEPPFDSWDSLSTNPIYESFVLSGLEPPQPKYAL